MSIATSSGTRKGSQQSPPSRQSAPPVAAKDSEAIGGILVLGYLSFRITTAVASIAWSGIKAATVFAMANPGSAIAVISVTGISCLTIKYAPELRAAIAVNPFAQQRSARAVNQIGTRSLLDFNIQKLDSPPDYIDSTQLRPGINIVNRCPSCKTCDIIPVDQDDYSIQKIIRVMACTCGFEGDAETSIALTNCQYEFNIQEIQKNPILIEKELKNKDIAVYKMTTSDRQALEQCDIKVRATYSTQQLDSSYVILDSYRGVELNKLQSSQAIVDPMQALEDEIEQFQLVDVQDQQSSDPESIISTFESIENT